MVLPLLGLVGLGAAAAIKPHYENRNARVRGEYNQGVIAGVDPNDPAAMRDALFRGGLLTGKDVQGDVRGAFESTQDRQAAMERQRVASAAGMMNAALNEKRYQDEVATRKQQVQARRDLGMPAAYEGIPSLQAAWDAGHANNSDAIRWAGMTPEQKFTASTMEVLNQERTMMEDAAAIRSAQGLNRSPGMQEAVAQRGRAWESMTPEARSDIMSQESAVQTIDSVFDYVQQTTAAGRVADPAQAASMATAYEMTVLPYMQQRFEAGAMQKEELELFKEIAGDPFAMNQFTPREQAKVQRILTEMQTDLRASYRAYDLNDTTPQAVPGNLVAGPAPAQPGAVNVPRGGAIPRPNAGTASADEIEAYLRSIGEM